MGVATGAVKSINRSNSLPKLDLSGAAIQGDFEERDPPILLPNQSDDISHLAIDIGGTLTKLVYFSRHADHSNDDDKRKMSMKEKLGISNRNRSYPILGGQLHFVKFETQKLNECLDFISSKQLHRGGIDLHDCHSPDGNATIKGLCAGVVVLLVSKGKSSRILNFSEELFFIYLLPPIIFNAGFQVKKKQFFRNFSTILLFGVVGTIISFCIISVGAFYLIKKIGITSLDLQDYLAIGAIFSATDSVCTLQVLNQEETPLLYSLVFGEGVVNDATSIVLFNAVQSLDFSNFNTVMALKLFGTFLYLFFTSTALGIAVGLISAYVIKTLYFGRHSTDREVAIMMIMAYLSYMLAELFSLSGILTVFFCGIVMSHYTWHNVTESSRVTTKHAFATISFIAETFIFLYVGMDALDIDKWKASKASAGTSVSVSATIMALVLIGRAAFVFPLANIANCFKTRVSTIVDLRQQFIIWWAGLMRGAVTIALSYSEFSTSGSTIKQDSALMITCTIIIVLFSTVVFGTITKPLIETMLFRRLKPAANADSEPASLEDIRLMFLERETVAATGEGNLGRNPMRNSLSLLIRHPTSTVHYFWRKFDDRFMRPVFGGRGFVPIVPGSPTSPPDEAV